MNSSVSPVTLRLLLQELNRDTPGSSEGNIPRRIRALKTTFRRTKDSTKLFEVIEILHRNCERQQIFDILLEDDFMEWLLGVMAEGCGDLGGGQVCRWAMAILATGTDAYPKFSSWLVDQPGFKDLLGRLIVKEVLSESLRMYTLFTISNVVFNCHQTALRSREVEEFLLRQSWTDIEAISIATLAAMMPAENLLEHEARVCSVLPQIIRDLEASRKSIIHRSTYCTLGETMVMMVALCKCREARRRLSESFKLLMIIEDILKDRTLQVYLEKARTLLYALYSEEQVRHIEEEVAFILQ